MNRDKTSLPRDAAGFNYIRRNIKRGATNRDLEWTLSDDDLKDIIVCPCFYCGSDPYNIVREMQQMYSPSRMKWNGIDRVDSSKGYVQGNIVPCCTQCNYMKRNYSQESFIEKARAIALRHPKVSATGGMSAGLLA